MTAGDPSTYPIRWEAQEDGVWVATLVGRDWTYRDGETEDDVFTATLIPDPPKAGEAPGWELEIEHDSRGGPDRHVITGESLEKAKAAAEHELRQFVRKWEDMEDANAT